jgi:3-hydroxybutyryl-CoA dehydrogenase
MSMGGKAKTRPVEQGSRPGPPTVYLTGDGELVLEYARLCLAKGYAVVCHANDGQLKGAFDKNSKAAVSDRVPKTATVGLELTNRDLNTKRQNLVRLSEALGADRLILSTSLVVSATEQSSWIEGRYRLIGFSALPTFSAHRSVEVAPTVSSPVETMEIARRFFASLGMDLEIVQDRIGMVFPRILCHAINEAAFAIQEGSTTPRDLDTAAALGTGFPRGPLEWAEHIGLPQVLAVLTALYNDLHEERYRVCPLLKQLAAGGQWWQRTPSPTDKEQ